MNGGADAYLASLIPVQRETLQALRALIRSVLPDAIECLSYAMPGFRQPGPNGKMVAGYAAFSRHLGLYPHSGTVIPRLADDCKGFKTSKSGILFTPQHPLPGELAHNIISTRLAEFAAGKLKRPKS